MCSFKMKLSIVIPAHNEQDNIRDVINKIEESLDLDAEYEIVVVNDHSSDNTAGIVLQLSKQYSNLRLVNNLTEGGFANALRAGFASVKTDVIIPVMADLCDDLGVIKQMFKQIDEGYDVVCATRYIKGGARLGGPKLKGFLSWFAGWSMHYLLGIPTHDIANSFKMYRKKVIDTVDTKARGFEISMEILLRAYYSGFKITEIPTIWKERTKGKSSFKVFKLLPDYIKLYIWAIYKRLTK